MHLKQKFYEAKDRLNHHWDKGMMKNNRWLSKQMLIMLVFVFILFVLIFGYKAFKNYMMNKYMMAGGIPPVAVSTIKVAYAPWQPKIKASGSLRAVQGVEVTTELSGLVRKILFTPGDEVEENAILVELNTDAEIAQLASLKATAELYKSIYERDKLQFDVKAVSQATLDTDIANWKSAEAQVLEQEATIAKKVIRAPFKGRLGISLINLGQYLNPGDTIVTLQTIDPIYADFYLPQQFLTQLSVGQKITLNNDTYPDVTFPGIISTVNPKVDADTRNVAVEALVGNPENQLLPGMFAFVEVITGKPVKRLTLPQTAISFNPYGSSVYVVIEKEMKGKKQLIAEQRFVTTGETRGDQIAIDKGLKEGEIAVTGGQLKLKNGSPVIINNTILPSNNPNPHLVNEPVPLKAAPVSKS